MKCEKCGKELKWIDVNRFNYDGSDSFCSYPYEEFDYDAVIIDTDPNWTGYELSEEEMIDTIECPHCHKFPFINTEIHVGNIVRIVCFKKGAGGPVDE